MTTKSNHVSELKAISEEAERAFVKAILAKRLAISYARQCETDASKAHVAYMRAQTAAEFGEGGL